jgi:HlyD family secretion protein
MLKVEEEKAAAARADAQHAQRYFERQIKLYNKGVISTEMLEQAETAAKRSRAGIAAAEAAVKAAKSELERAQATVHFSPANDASTKSVITTVISPIDGKILHIYRKSEGAVQPGEPLLDLGDPQDLEVRVEALSTDAVRIARGTPVLFQRWGGDYPLAGTVRTVEPAGFTKISSLGVEEQRVPIVIDFTSIDQAARRLGHGFRLEASFTIWEAADVLQVPASALFREQDGWGVFVVKNNRAYKTKVQIGHRNGLAAEIVSGIGEGDMVVSHPDNTIKDAIHVRLQ